MDVQRGGPSTGLPTKTEQADLLQALYGRNGESPVAVVAPKSPSDCFDAAIEAVRIAVTYRTPVLLLSDGYLANGQEPWAIPDLADLPTLNAGFATEPNGPDGEFLPFLRDPETLARPWAIPGTPGLAHRVGGIEKADRTGNISYDPDNHDTMVRLRQAKIDGIDVPDLEVDDPDGDADLLVIGWGSTLRPHHRWGSTRAQGGQEGRPGHLRHLSPMPKNTGEVLRSYRKVLVPEMNLGQLALLLRGRFLVDAVGFNQVRGLPFTAPQMQDVINEMLEGCDDRDPAESQGFQVRPGGSVVPGLWRLRDPSRRCSPSCPNSAANPRTSCSSPGSAARRDSRTTCRPTACTRSMAVHRQSPPACRSVGRTWTCGW